MKTIFTNVRKITTPYFPKWFLFAAPLVAGFGGYLIYTHHEIWAGFVILLSVIFLTTHYATEINLVQKTYRDYLFFLGFRLNAESGKFSNIEKISDYTRRLSGDLHDDDSVERCRVQRLYRHTGI